MTVGDLLFSRYERRDSHENRHPTDTESDRADGETIEFHPGDPSIHECRYDECNRTERLHHDERRQVEADQLQDDRKSQQEGTEQP